ncbi:MAG: trehalose-phosphatase [Gammaproteobacteria bacterium]|nr:trehalose-phosphatase [Gammaproteobacteria bacterium]
MSHDAVNRKARWALFLDVDGTLLELAETPESVYVPPELRSLLSTTASRLEGALALVSGRTIADLDRLFAPLRLCASGVHGAERRGPDGRLIREPLDLSGLHSVREELAAYARSHQGILLEDKGYALAVHFRLAPQLADSVHALTKRIVERLGPQYVLQAGKCVYEIRPSATTKGTAVRTFMQQSPFLARQPIYIGDDVTDEDAFETVNALGGISIRVGESAPTRATYRLARVADVHKWLRELSVESLLMRGP